MKTFETTGYVLKETEKTLTLVCKDGPTYKNYYGKAKKKQKDQASSVYPLPVNVNKKYLQEGSDKLGIPSVKQDKKDKPVRAGKLVLPFWYARQKALWEALPEIEECDNIDKQKEEK